jgi:hypothetical protein
MKAGFNERSPRIVNGIALSSFSNPMSKLNALSAFYLGISSESSNCSLIVTLKMSFISFYDANAGLLNVSCNKTPLDH